MAGDRSLNNAVLIHKNYCNFVANDNTQKLYMMLLGAVKKNACTSNVTKLEMGRELIKWFVNARDRGSNRAKRSRARRNEVAPY